MNKIKDGFRLMLEGFNEKYGLNTNDPNFFETPDRIERFYDEMFSGVKETEKKIDEILSKTFPFRNDQMVLINGIKVFSLCPHHFLPVEYNISIGYIPTIGGHVLGLSKLSRICDILAKRPVLQEDFTNDIATYLFERLDKCLGSACVVKGRHYCMIMRGVKQTNSETVNSSLKGVFLEDTDRGVAARNEFMRLCNGNI